MIVGNLNALPLAGLPPALRQILALPQATLAALSARQDGRWQPEGCRWFCNIGEAHTQPTAQRRISPAVGRYSGDAGGLRGD